MRIVLVRRRGAFSITPCASSQPVRMFFRLAACLIEADGIDRVLCPDESVFFCAPVQLVSLWFAGNNGWNYPEGSL
jgi:hypothetical protein